MDNSLGEASALLGQARYADAAEVLKEPAEQNCDPRAALLFAAALEAGGNLSASEQALQKAHAAWPENNSIATSLAREYMSAGQTDQALRALAHFHVTSTTRLQEVEMAAVVYLAAHKLVLAEGVARAAYRSAPSEHTLLLLANTLQLQGRVTDVHDLLAPKRKEYADSAAFLITLAENEYDESMFTMARDDVARAIAMDNTSYQAHYILGNVLVRLNDPDRAIAEYEAAIELQPNQPRTYFQLAMVLRTKKDDVGEARALAQALAADDHYAPAHCEMGRILLEQNRTSDAVGHLQVALRDNPRYEEAYFLLIRAYTKLGEKDKANAMAKQLVLIRKENRPGPEDLSSRHVPVQPASK